MPSKRELLLSKFEYTKKQSVINKTDKGNILSDILDKVENNVELEHKDKLLLLSSLEYTFKKAYNTYKESPTELSLSNKKEQAIKLLFDLGV